MSILFSADELTSWTGGQWINLEPETLNLNGFCHDTRLLKPGELFLALATDNRDGHDFLEQARAAGALAAMVDRPVSGSTLPQLVVPDVLEAFQKIAKRHRHRFSGIIIGVTGSCGKTSTKELLRCLLGPEQTHVTEKNYNNLLGVPLTLIGLNPHKHKYGVIEAGANQLGELPTLAAIIEPDIAITTLIEGAHLEGLGGSLERIAQEKSTLSHRIATGGFSVFPEDCLNYAPFKVLENSAYVLIQDQGEASSSVPKGACSYKLSTTDSGLTCLTLQYEEATPCTFYMRPLTQGMASNAALAIWVALSLGVGPSLIQERLELWQPVENRGQILRKGSQYFYSDCYSAIPAAFYDSLEFFQRFFANVPQHLYVLGAMRELGDATEAIHYELGRQLSLRPNDQVIVIGEEAEPLVRGLLKVGCQPARITFVADADKARPFMQGFEGALFLKGNNGLQLWELIPEGAQVMKINKFPLTNTQPC